MRCSIVAKPLEIRHLFSGHKVKGEEAQTAEVVDVKGLLPLKRDYLTYQVEAFNLILFLMMISSSDDDVRGGPGLRQQSKEGRSLGSRQS